MHHKSEEGCRGGAPEANRLRSGMNLGSAPVRSPPLADAPRIDDRAVGRLGDDVHVLVLVRRGARVVRREGEQATNRVSCVLERGAVRRAHLTALLLEIGDAQLRVLGEPAVAGGSALGGAPSLAVRGHSGPSEVIRGNQRRFALVRSIRPSRSR